MKDLSIQYHTSVISLPGKVADVLDRAGSIDLKVLIALCSQPSLCQGCDDENWVNLVAEKAGCDPDSVTSAVSFWRGAGILSFATQGRGKPQKKASQQPQEEPPQPTTPVPAPVPAPQEVTPAEKPKLTRTPELPRYTSEELAKLLQERNETLSFINECQRIWGKVFNTHEVNIILGLVDYLGLDYDYVLSLLVYFANEQARRGMRKSLQNVEKKAFELYDRDIQTVEALREEIQRIEQMKEVESQLRSLFGMGARALTPKEKKCFSAWLYDFGYDMTIIRMAYDVTVDAKGTPNIGYMNSVLANWHKDNLRTPEDIQKAQEARQQSQATPPTASKKRGGQESVASNRSFDVEDFFSAAVRRSFGDDFSDTDTDQ